MYLPGRPEIKNSRSMLRAFGGLNETYGCTEAEFSQALNFSSRDFPALSTRLPRRKLRAAENVRGMYQLGGLLMLCGTTLHYTPDDAGEEPVTLENAVSDTEKALVGIGTKILIFPDQLAFDTADGSLTALGARWSGEETALELTPCDADGKTYTVDRWGLEEPEDPADGEIFLKAANVNTPWRHDGVLEVYSQADEKWNAVTLDHCLLSGEGLSEAFRQWDTVTVSGTAAILAGMGADLDGEQVLYNVEEGVLRVRITPQGDHFYGYLKQEGTAVTWTSIDDSETEEYTAEGPAVIERRVPELEYLTECDNRVWGCNSQENVIYACKLGDPTNWFSYQNSAADSYAVTVGSDGHFTGAATCMGYALFFKENVLHKLYGSKPSDFQLTSLNCRGVAQNAAKSLCVINETLYYLSRDGVMSWDGSIPVKASAALDPSGFSNVRRAVSGQLDGRYYLHITRDAGTGAAHRLLVYDTERSLWQEEGVCSYQMAGTGSQLYLWDGEALWIADPRRETGARTAEEGEDPETRIPFELVTGEFGLDEPEDKYISRLVLRLEAEPYTTLEIAASYDGGVWETLLARAVGAQREKLALPLLPRRHDTLRLRIRGQGQITLRSLTRTFAAARGGLTQ